jgi:sarcosine oxidase subunit beta
MEHSAPRTYQHSSIVYWRRQAFRLDGFADPAKQLSRTFATTTLDKTEVQLTPFLATLLARSVLPTERPARALETICHSSEHIDLRRWPPFHTQLYGAIRPLSARLAGYPTPMQRYSGLALLRHALSGHLNWKPVWRSPRPRAGYDVVIVGGGGHGLATAYYLASRHGIRNVAVLEKGWLGGGNSGRNTQVSRSNYFYPESTRFFDHSLRLYETLGRDLNFNVMLSQRGVLALAASSHELELARRWANAIRLNGIDAEMMSPVEIQRLIPRIDLNGRMPIVGGFIQRRGGISRHDAVNWAFARAADSFGVDIIQGCEVQSFTSSGGRISGVVTNRGTIGATKVAVAVAGHSSHLAQLAGFRLPLTSMTLQAMVTEPVKPVLDTVIMSPAVHVYVSQSNRGELVIGGGADVYHSYMQRGSLATTEAVVTALIELFPSFSRLRLMRQWGGVVDISPDTSPIIGKTPIDNLYISCGWGTGGYKAIPAGGDTLAYTIVHDKPHPLIEAFSLDRFSRGALVDEGAAAGVAH